MSAGSFTGILQVSEKGPKAHFLVSKLGRFGQPDTIVPGYTNPQSLNRYSYVLNSPVSVIDPTGNVPICIDGEQCQSIGLAPSFNYSSTQSLYSSSWKPFTGGKPPSIWPTGGKKVTAEEDLGFLPASDPDKNYTPSEDVPNWSTTDLLPPDLEKAEDLYEAAGVVNSLATFYSGQGALFELTATGIGCFSGVGMAALFDGPAPIADTGGGIAGCATGYKVGNKFYRLYYEPKVDRLNLLSTNLAFFADALAGETRIDIYDDHLTVQIGAAYVESGISTLLDNGIVHSAVLDTRINLYDAATNLGYAPAIINDPITITLYFP